MEKKLEKDLDRTYLIFLDWQASPPAERVPRTIKDFCEKFNIEQSDLAGFEASHGYYDDLEDRARKWGRSKIPEMLHLLYVQIKARKKASDIETFKRLITVEANTPQGNTINIFNLNDQQKRQILQREARAAGILEAGGTE